MPVSNFNVQRVYLKDLSLEVPNSPHIFLSREPMTVDINLNLRHTELGNGIFEVVEAVTVTSRAAGNVVYLVEAQQAAVVEIPVLTPQTEIDSLLRVNLPYFLHPFARANIADCLIRAGFSPFHIPDVSFEQMLQIHAPSSMAIN